MKFSTRNSTQTGARQYALNLEQLRLVAFADSSFASLEGCGRQIGCVVIPTDDMKHVNWIHFSRFKCRRVLQSEIDGKTYAFVDTFNAAFIIKHDLERRLESLFC